MISQLNTSFKASTEDYNYYDYDYDDDDGKAAYFAIITRTTTIVGCLFAVGSVVANMSTLLAISMTVKPLTANLRFVVSLSISDALMSACAIFASAELHFLYDFKYCLRAVKKRVRVASSNLTLLSLLCLAVDHYYAICRPLQHRTGMSPRTVNAIVVFFWMASLAAAFADFVVPFQVFRHCGYDSSSGGNNFCEFVYCSVYNSEYVVLALAAVVLVGMLVFYVLICRKVYRFKVPTEKHPAATWRNRRALYTSVIIVGVFVGCWLPYSTFVVHITVYLVLTESTGHDLEYLLLSLVIEPILYTLVLLNSFIDPFIYALRMVDVQLGYKRLAARLCCRRSEPVQRTNVNSRRVRWMTQDTSVTQVSAIKSVSGVYADRSNSIRTLNKLSSKDNLV